MFRTGGGVLAIGAAVLALSGFGPEHVGLMQAAAQPDQRFVEAVRAQGWTVEAGGTEALVVRAAHKLCDRRDGTRTNTAARRANALTTDEIEAVRRTFGDDARAFTKVALRTYCP